MLNDYDEEIKKNPENEEKADMKFMNDVKINNIDPSEKLEITLYDKAIFIAVIYLTRYVSLMIIELLIKRNYIDNILSSIIYYTIIYTLILILLIFIVNFDTYKLRVIFNYLNLNINTLGLLTHIITFYIFIYLVYVLTINLSPGTLRSLFFDYSAKSSSDLTFGEQLKILYRLDILTIVVFVFSIILVLVM